MSDTSANIPTDTAARPIDLSVDIAGLRMKNPVTTASGTYASGREYAAFVDPAALGAVTTKGVSLNGWAGNPGLRIVETSSGMLNSIGLQNPGVQHLIDEDLPWLKARGATVIVNVSGHSVDEYVQVIEALEEAPAGARPHAYEVNISCPNVDAGGMAFGTQPDAAARVTAACRAATRLPLIVKLSPNVTSIADIARAAEAAGADALSLINTVLGMAVDARTRTPLLARAVGGLSGPAVKPIALRMVWECSRAVQIPLIGMGGVTTGTDAVEFMLAGASAVAVGTANFSNPRATLDCIEGIRAYCAEQGVSAARDLIGALEV